jgi:hypothetical protein
MLLDRDILEEILYFTCTILKKHFFYDEEGVMRFLHIFTDTVEFELIQFGNWANQQIQLRLKYDQSARFYFTSYFVSVNLRNVMVEHLHFSESELEAFDNFLPKYSEVIENVKSYNQRAHY